MSNSVADLVLHKIRWIFKFFVVLVEPTFRFDIFGQCFSVHCGFLCEFTFYKSDLLLEKFKIFNRRFTEKTTFPWRFPCVCGHSDRKFFSDYDFLGGPNLFDHVSLSKFVRCFDCSLSENSKLAADLSSDGSFQFFDQLFSLLNFGQILPSQIFRFYPNAFHFSLLEKSFEVVESTTNI